MPRIGMKIHPLNSKAELQGKMTNERSIMVKTKLRRIFDWQFQSATKNTCVENRDPRPIGESSSKAKTSATNNHLEAAGVDHEPSSVCLAEMVHEFLENGEKASDCGRARCSCLYGHFSGDRNPDSEDDGKSSLSYGEVGQILKSLVPCPSLEERNLLADASKFVEEVNNEGITLCKDKNVCTNGCLRRALTGRLRSKGYNAAVCRAKWDQANGYPSGEYEYIDVLEGESGKQERIIVDIDFRSQFEIARSTGDYDSVLQILPVLFVGKADRLQQIINIVCDAARQSLKKKHMHIPPWRRFEYMQAKWLSPIKRTTAEDGVAHSSPLMGETPAEVASVAVKGSGWGTKFRSEFELQFRGNGISPQPLEGARTESSLGHTNSSDQITVVVSEWQPPAVKPKSGQRGGKIAAGLASMLREAGLSSKS